MMNFVSTLGLVLAVGAPGPKDVPKKAEPPTIVGDWACSECVGGGRAFPAEVLPMIGMQFTADGKFEFRFGPEAGAGTYTSDPAKDPPEMDYSSAKAAKGNKAIYKIEKDTLTFCFTEGGGDRPTKFESPAGSRILLLTFKRAEKKKD